MKWKRNLPWQDDSSLAPSVLVDFEKGHSVHLDAPKLFEYDPIGHKEHSGVPYVDQEPGLQVS